MKSSRNEVFITRHMVWFSTRVSAGVRPTTLLLLVLLVLLSVRFWFLTRLFGAPCPGFSAIPLAMASLGAGQRCPPSLSTIPLVYTGTSGMGLLGAPVPITTLDGGKG